MVAMGQSNALAVDGFRPSHSWLHAPDEYTKKLVVNRLVTWRSILSLPWRTTCVTWRGRQGKPLTSCAWSRWINCA
ncbi:hypothetical protein ACNKHL_17680 [Shigella flexneri]